MRTKLAGLVLVVGLATAACGSNDSAAPADLSAAPKAGGSLTVADPLVPSSLDPIASFGGGDHMSLYPIYDRLVNFDAKTLKPEPGLATSWKFSDPKTLVLALRDGVKFQDGTPVNADAVKFNLDRAINDKTSKIASDLATVDSVKVTGPVEATIHLKQPDASIVLTLADRAGMMASPTAVKKWGADYSRHPVGAGAYVFDKYAANDQLVVQKNKDYWQAGRPYLNTITFKYFADQQTANNALQAHQADVVLNADLADVSTLKAMSGVKVLSAPSLLTGGCYINFSRAPFNNVDARHALAVAIDRKALNKSYAFGLAEPTSSIFPKGYWAADAKLDDTFAYDPDKARDLLAKAGHSGGLKITGLAFQDTGEVRRAEIIQEQLKKVGIDMKLEVFDAATVAKKFFTDKAYDIACASWSGRPDPSQTAGSLLSSTSFYNAGAYAAPGMPEALSAAAAAQTDADRVAALSKVVDLNQQSVVWLPLLSEPNVTAASDKVQGIDPNLYGKIDVSFLSLIS
ncbi:ABC transporter substrate-binding protein [Streptomyces sp. JH14]|uniref:ABC transporter substrate-binding protein n=1 Tax=Streptomyces sp. JH14 TaxID=2793630 RepID=UPI0023F9D961|nr:ABC transporter substrate-binding protein [Streptomyces sp. JH14]MDF6046122.1 ABC transporter substrate-binding protein [Streptomyces sp. JH14]